MFWSDRVLPWISEHSLSLILTLCLIVLAIVLFSLAFQRRLSSALLNPRAVSFTPGPSVTTQQPATQNPAAANLNPEITYTTNRYLQEKKNVGLSVPPTARLVDDIGMTPDDLTTAIHDLLAATRRGYNSHSPNTSLTTVGDLILYVQNAPILGEESRPN